MVGIERKLGPKGQIVIPEEIRKLKGLRPGSVVVFDIEDEKISLKSKEEDVVSWLEQEVKKHGKKLGKIDWDKSYEEQLKERARRAGIGLSRR
jgi:AbrB family looped-hinge helix DNA binding protein